MNKPATKARLQHERLLPHNWWIAALVAGAAVVGLVVHQLRSPYELLDLAREAAKTNLAQAEELTIRALGTAWLPLPEGELLRAELLGRMGHWDEAYGQFSVIAHPARLPPGDLYRFAHLALQAKSLGLAERAFLAARGDSEHSSDVLRSLIQIYLQTGREDSARIFARELVQQSSQDAIAWQVLGAIEVEHKNLQLAEEAFRTCLKHSPPPETERAVREELVRILLDRGEPGLARRELAELATRGPLSPRAAISLAYVERMEGQPEVALEVLRAQFANNETLPLAARFLRGMVYDDLEQYTVARRDLEWVVARQPWNKEAYQKLANSCRALGDLAEANAHLQRADQLQARANRLLELVQKLRESPQSRQIRHELAAAYRELGQPEQAERILGGPLSQ